MHSKAKLFKGAKSTSFQSSILIYSTKTFTWLYLKLPKNNNNQPLAPLMQWLASLAKAEGDFQSLPPRAVPRIFCLQGQTPQTFTGISRIQTGFLVKHYVRKKKVFLAGATAPPCPPCPPTMYGPAFFTTCSSSVKSFFHLTQSFLIPWL